VSVRKQSLFTTGMHLYCIYRSNMCIIGERKTALHHAPNIVEKLIRRQKRFKKSTTPYYIFFYLFYYYLTAGDLYIDRRHPPHPPLRYKQRGPKVEERFFTNNQRKSIKNHPTELVSGLILLKHRIIHLLLDGNRKPEKTISIRSV
jgi:hypothetical protein